MAAIAAVVAVAADAASRVGNAMKAWTKGDRVVQPTYGPGTLVEVNEHHTVIDFDEHGIRRFSTSMVKLERSSTVEPGKPPKRTRKKAVAKES